MNIQNLPDSHEIEKVLGLGPQAQAKRWAKRGIWLAVLALAIIGSYLWYQNSQTTANAVTYETSPAKRADLTVTVTATGTIQPTTQIADRSRSARCAYTQSFDGAREPL